MEELEKRFRDEKYSQGMTYIDIIDGMHELCGGEYTFEEITKHIHSKYLQ